MKARTLIGGITFIIGFLIYQTGTSIALEQIPYTLNFLRSITTILQLNLKTDLSILFVEYVGGIIAIAGFLICVSSLASKETAPISITSEEREGELLSGGLLGGFFSPEPTLKCKYCGAYIENGDVFCGKCNRALE
ncbi:zinc ribbon domain-containing protein [Candidatus Bathyarchaeota archaeon]|nr:zinc ribbon domain-containing protein [Candidatus Bathyarchaeota archaeon]